MGVPDNAYDTVVTSGDVTRTLIAAGPRKVYHIGPERDLNLFEGLDRELVDAQEAEVIVCSGLVDDTVETPADYTEAFGRLQARGLDFICANPDLVVERGDSLIYCAGALAAEYARLGGRNRIAGKPYRPIYELAIGEAENLSGGTIDRSQILAIGDGMPTDIKGAADFGIDALYISAGIHAAEYGPADQPDHEALNAFLAARGASPVAYMPRLDW